MPSSLVTGGAGFVGANLVRRLLGDGERVTTTVGPGTDTWRLDGVAGDLEIVEADIRDRERMLGLVRRVAPVHVFHLAAHGAYSWQTDVARIFETNLVGTAALLDACVVADVEAVVHAGSSSEYGFQDHAPSEDEAPKPNSAYAVAKAAATQLCTSVANTSELRVTTLRLYSVYGPFEEPMRLMPRLIAFGLEGSLPPLADPTTARDFVFVDDVVDAFLRVVDADTGERGAVYNVGSGVQTTLAEVVNAARALLSIEDSPVWSSGEVRSWDTDTWIADVAKIDAAVGWRALHDLDQGLRMTIDWILQPDWRARYARDARRP